jgi:hypothetical protein
MNTIDAISMKTGLLILLLIVCSTTFADNAPVTPPTNPVLLFKCPKKPVPRMVLKTVTKNGNRQTYISHSLIYKSLRTVST